MAAMLSAVAAASLLVGAHASVSRSSTLAFFNRPNVLPPCSNCSTLEYQTYDGSCNNLYFPDQGKIGGVYSHVAPGDWARPILGGALPDPLKVSRELFLSKTLRLNPAGANALGTTLPSQDEDDEENGVNQLFTEFGQFVNHDLENNKNTDPASLTSKIAYGDTTGDLLMEPSLRNFPGVPFNPFNPPGLNYLVADDSVGELRDGKLWVTNLGNSYLDLSTIYGTDAASNKALRTLSKGQLLTGSYIADAGIYAPSYPALTLTNVLPSSQTTGIPTGVVSVPPFTADATAISGDARASENVFLATQHLIWLREHNRLANWLSTQYPRLSDERLFQLARRINIAQYQQVVYNEFVPILTGQAVPSYTGYRPSVDATTSIEFASAALRYGHTNVEDIDIFSCGTAPIGVHNFSQMAYGLGIPQYNTNRLSFNGATFTLGAENMDMSYARLLRLAAGSGAGVDPTDNLLVSALRARAGKTDLSESSIFQLIPLLDLGALDIARGRRNAVPSYNALRKYYGGDDIYTRAGCPRPAVGSTAADPIVCFAAITADVAVQQKLQKVYGQIEKIDAIVGFLAEDRAAGKHVGPTLGRLMLREFIRKRDGDRFYVPWTLATVSASILRLPGVTSVSAALKTFLSAPVKYSAIIARNTGVKNVQASAFKVPPTTVLPEAKVCSVGFNTLEPANLANPFLYPPKK